jgi:hypothetical protein
MFAMLLGTTLLPRPRPHTSQLLVKQQTHGGGKHAASVLQQFEASEVQELPPRLRALFEDSKVRVLRAAACSARPTNMLAGCPDDGARRACLQQRRAPLRAWHHAPPVASPRAQAVKEELRRYRARCQELERARLGQDVRLGQLQEALARAAAGRADGGDGGGAGGGEEASLLRREVEAKARLLEVRSAARGRARVRPSGEIGANCAAL